ncbi:MAG: efflux RND transporter permease subunit [Bacteroidales bacterium]|nr:efflux RND transporter permease subunit [Bacteroidales bacterium]
MKTSGPYQNIEEIKNTVVNSYKGQLVYLKNIADVSFGYEDLDYIGRLNGKKAIFLSAMQKDGLNIFTIMDKINPVIHEYNEDPVYDIPVVEVFNQSEFVDERINGFMNNLLQGIVLVGFVVLLIFGIRSSIIVILAIPFSFLIGLAVLDYAGFGLQQISIAGLVVALGLLVDNSIVVVENINRFLQLGYKPKDAAYEATREIGWPVVSATLTTVFAFIPIMMMQNDAGNFMKSMPVIVIASLTASLIIALTITPLASGYLLNRPEKNKYSISRFLDRFIQGPYRKVLLFSLKNRKSVFLLISFIFIISIAVHVLFVGTSFFPKAELPQFLVRIEMPQGTSLERTNKATAFVESVLNETPGVIKFATNVGHGNPRIYYNTFPRDYDKNFAEFYVRLEKFDVDEFDELIETLRKNSMHLQVEKLPLRNLNRALLY